MPAPGAPRRSAARRARRRGRPSSTSSEGAVVVLDPGRRREGAGRRPLLWHEPVQPRRQSAAPARLGLQALRLPHRPREGGYARLDRIDEPVAVGGWSAEEPHRHLSRRGHAPRQPRPVDQHRRGQAGAGGRPQERGRTAKRLGIIPSCTTNPSIALGTAEVTLLELTRPTPLRQWRRGGIAHIVARVRNGDGKMLYEREGQAPAK